MTRPDNPEVTVVEGGDPGYAEPFGDSNHGGVGATQPQVSIGDDQLADARPVVPVKAGDFELPAGDGGIETGLGLRTELPSIR